MVSLGGYGSDTIRYDNNTKNSLRNENNRKLG